MKAIDYAKKSCDTMMRKFKAPDLPPVGKFHYHQGVFLSGMLNTYKVCKDEKYFEYVKNWVDSIIWQDGSIHEFDKSMLDDIQPGILLFYLYERTGDERYKIALETLMPVLKNWKSNEIGGFWHKMCHPEQMWLDGLYMAGPLEAEFGAKFGDSSYIETAINQAIIMHENIQDKKTKLLYHAWDYSKEIVWADKTTGLAPEFWGRALGWYVVAILDILDFVPENHEKRSELINIEIEVLKAIIDFQDKKTGMWYQVVDKGNMQGNWLETSCSCLFTYAIAKAVRTGILDKSYLKIAQSAFEGVVNSLETDGDDLLIGGVCVGTGVCTYEGYINRPTSINDLHGVGAFLLMCAEMAIN